MPRAPPRAHECEMKRSRSGAGEEERDISLFSHPCDRLISLLHYPASAAGTGFNSSPLYHWATMVVNLDYLLYRLLNPSITSTRLVQQPGNQISPKSRPGGFTWKLLCWEDGSLLRDLGTQEVWAGPQTQVHLAVHVEWTTTEDLLMGSNLWLLSVTMTCFKSFVLDVSAAPVKD